MIELRPISLREANRIVDEHHSHHDPAGFHRFSISAWYNGKLVGVVIVGNPKAGPLQNGTTFEVVRLCAIDGRPRNTCSRLLGAAWRASKAMGCTKLVSYTRADESGDCYRASGWTPVANVKGREWNTGNKATRWLPGFYEPSTEIVDRVRWEIPASSSPLSE